MLAAGSGFYGLEVAVAFWRAAGWGVSLAKGSGEGTGGATVAILAWIGGTAVLALLALAIGRRLGALAVAEGVAGGFSIGDISTKLATQGGARFAFAATLIIGYTLGTSLLQLGYQRGGALAVAGLATLMTNALPIAAGTLVPDEPVPSGVLGALRVLAFVAVTASAVLLATPDRQRAAAPETMARPPAPEPAEQIAGGP